jgi:hypothetical protein
LAATGKTPDVKGEGSKDHGGDQAAGQWSGQEHPLPLALYKATVQGNDGGEP